jgi:uncharacterized protein (TIRG00374 family)
MIETKRKNLTQDLRRMLPGISITIVFIVVLLLFIDIQQVKEAWQTADYRFVPPAAMILLLSILGRAFGWRAILQEKISVGKTFLTLNEGYTLNTFLPFRLGELGRAMLLSSTTDLSIWEVLTTIMVERIFDLALMSGLLLSSLPFVVGADWALQAAITTGILVVIGFAILFILAHNQTWAIQTFEYLFGRWPRLIHFGRSKIKLIFAGLAALTDLRRFLTVLFWMTTSWVLNVSWYYLLLHAFFDNPKPLWGIFTVGMTGLGVTVPSSPGFVGVLEGSIVFALTLFGLNNSSALAYAVLSHAIYFLVTVSLGIFALTRDGESLSHLYSKLRQRKGTQSE